MESQVSSPCPVVYVGRAHVGCYSKFIYICREIYSNIMNVVVTV